jgi:hypothetical protein
LQIGSLRAFTHVGDQTGARNGERGSTFRQLGAARSSADHDPQLSSVHPRSRHPSQDMKSSTHRSPGRKHGSPGDAVSKGTSATEWLVLGAVFAYVAAFCLALPARRLTFAYFLIPDELVSQWCGGDVARFGVLDRLPILLVAAWILFVSWAAGRLVLDALRVDHTLTSLERFVFAAGIGSNLVSLVTLLAGLSGLLHTRVWFLAVTLAASGLALLRARVWRSRGAAATKRNPETQHPRILWLATPLSLAILFVGMLPPWHFDAREYHFQVPKEWYQQGSVDFLPHNIYGNMPLGAEMHALLGMVLAPDESSWWWGTLVGKTVIAVMPLLTALALYTCGRRFVSPLAGAVAAIVFLSTPGPAHLSSAGLNEGALGLYFLLAAYAALVWQQQSAADMPRNSDWRWASICGLLAGSALACKYPSLLFLVMPLFVFLAVGWPPRPRWLSAVAFACGVAIASGPWLAKNMVLSGNPFYPLLYDWFDGLTRTAENNLRWVQAHQPPLDAFGNRYSAGQIVDSLLTLVWTSSFLGPLLVPLALVGLGCRRYRRLVLVLLGYGLLVFIAWWMLTHRVDRFLVPLLPLAALLAGIGASRSNAPAWKRCVLGLLVFGTIYGVLFNLSRSATDNRILIALEQLRDDLPDPRDDDFGHLDPVHAYLNKIVEPGYTLLSVGDAQVFDLRMPLLYNTCFDACHFEQLMKDRSREERLQAFRNQRISHVLVSWRELDRYRSPGNYGYSDYVTRQRVREELVAEQGVLRPLPLGIPVDALELFEVSGWEDW